MKKHSLYEIGAFFTTTLDMAHVGLVMNREGLGIIERMEEIMDMCHRKQPIYDQASCFSVAMYALGLSDDLFDFPDLLSYPELDSHDAARILKDHFTEVPQDAIPSTYHITESRGTYLLVVGDPLFPRHMAVVTNRKSERPFFSKLPFLGAGFDSLEELEREFAGIDGLTPQDFHYFKKNGA